MGNFVSFPDWKQFVSVPSHHSVDRTCFDRVSEKLKELDNETRQEVENFIHMFTETLKSHEHLKQELNSERILNQQLRTSIETFVLKSRKDEPVIINTIDSTIQKRTQNKDTFMLLDDCLLYNEKLSKQCKDLQRENEELSKEKENALIR